MHNKLFKIQAKVTTAILQKTLTTLEESIPDGNYLIKRFYNVKFLF